MNDPLWYKNLSPQKREAVDQTLHLICGLGICAIAGSYVSMVSLYVREFWLQWPVERVADTRKDMAYWILGTGICELLRFFGW